MNHPIRNCRFKFKCDAAWENLDATDNPSVRHCGACERTVHLCTNDQQLARAMLQNHCVAIPKRGTLPGHVAQSDAMMIGEVGSEYLPDTKKPKQD